MRRGVLIDANLLCLLAVGRVDRHAITGHPRLRAFDADDLDLLGSVLDRFGDLILCPQVLAETSNLLAYRQAPPQRARWWASLADLVDQGAERNEPAVRAVAVPAYLRLGLTDATLVELLGDRSLILLSDDLALCLEAERRGARAVNYNYLRDGALTVDQIAASDQA